MSGTGGDKPDAQLSGAERRKFPRFSNRLSLTYAVLGTHEEGRGVTKDISGGGTRFVAEHRLAVGMHLDMTMRVLGRDEPVKFIAKVMWSKPVGISTQPSSDTQTEVGVQFQDIDPKDRVLIIQEGAVYNPRASSA